MLDGVCLRQERAAAHLQPSCVCYCMQSSSTLLLVTNIILSEAHGAGYVITSYVVVFLPCVSYVMH